MSDSRIMQIYIVCTFHAEKKENEISWTHTKYCVSKLNPFPRVSRKQLPRKKSDMSYPWILKRVIWTKRRKDKYASSSSGHEILSSDD